MSDNQSDQEDNIVIKSVPEVSKDNLMKVPVSKNYKRIGEYSSMIQKEQFLELPEEIENPIPEPSEIENTIPINNYIPPSPAYVLKMTKLRPASSYAKPSKNESRNIVTVPYKPTVKLPCKVLKPIKKLNMIKTAKVPKKAPFNPRDDAIAIKHIKEKLYLKSYLKVNEDEPIALKYAPKSPTNHHSDSDCISELSRTKVVEKLPIKIPKVRRNTIAERPPKVKKIKSPKKQPKKEPKLPKQKAKARSE